MRKLVCAVLVFMMVFTMIGISIPKAKAMPAIYGDVYLVNANIPEVWSMLNWKLPQGCPSLELIPTYEMYFNTHTIKALGLVNEGIITQIVILIPVCDSYVFVLLDGAIHCYPLIVHSITNNCIVFTFESYP